MNLSVVDAFDFFFGSVAVAEASRFAVLAVVMLLVFEEALFTGALAARGLS